MEDGGKHIIKTKAQVLHHDEREEMQPEKFINEEAEDITKFEYLGPTTDQKCMHTPLERDGKVYQCSRLASNDL